MTRGGKREGAGRKVQGADRRVPWNTRVEAGELETLRTFPQASAASMLAQGLRLGRGNLPEFTAAERVLLAEVLRGADPLALRHLEDEVADIEDDLGGDLPEREHLIAKLRPLGDWERLALALEVL